jgi:carbon monoxide dehydrogenase subunit G
MQLEQSFTVPVGIDEAWRVLLDIERVAPCMPGATIESVDGDAFTGAVKVRVGPIALQYRGKASFTEKDESAHRAVIDAQGRDTRGNGTAAAKVTTSLRADGGETRVDVITDLTITGKPAQFGRGVIAEVSNKLIGQFAECLAKQLSGAPEPAAESATAGAESPAAARADSASDAQPINLVRTAGPAVAKRAVPPLLVLLLIIIVIRRLVRD